jgi:arylsulfatase A-like enzyme
MSTFTLVLLAAGTAALVGCGEKSLDLEPYRGDLESTRVVHDLVKRAKTATVVRPSAVLDAGASGSFDALAAGWGKPEIGADTDATFVWAVAERAVVETTLLEADAVVLELRCRPFHWEGAPEQRLSVEVNGSAVGEAVLSPGFRDYSFALPRGVVGPGLNRVELEFAWTAAPADHLPGNTDTRTLAAAFERIVLGVGNGSEPRTVTAREPESKDREIAIPPGTGLVYRLIVPENAVLDFGLSTAARGVEGLRGRVWLATPGEPATATAAVDPAMVVGERVRFAIEADAGSTVELGLAATGDGPPDSVLVVHTPRVLGDGNEAAEIASVLLVVVDTLRADYLGVYGAGVHTPVIDELAARGVLFSRARSHIPITGPSHASLFTSLLPMEHGVVNNAQELSDEFMTLAESMRAGGRQTAAVISLGVMQRQFGFHRGFDRYGDDFPRDWMKSAGEVTDEVLALTDESLAEPYFLWAHYSDPHEPYAPPGLAYPRIELRLAGEPLGEIDAGGRGNRFELELPPGASELEFAPLDPEPGRSYRFDTLILDDREIAVEPLDGWKLRKKRVGRPTYQSELPASLRLTNPADATVTTELLLTCKQLLRKPEIRERYAGEVEYADREIGRLLEGLTDRGLMDNTLVIFVSDHGEGLGNHDHVGHVSQLYDTLLHVPLILVWPDRVPEGLVVDDPVSLVDVFPTVADLLGLERPEMEAGLSLAPLLGDGRLPPRPFLAATYPPESASSKRAIVLDGHKLIHSWTDARDWEELYDVVNDPGELENLLETRAETAERLRVELKRRLVAMSESSPIEAELSEEDKAQLRALGYLH